MAFESAKRLLRFEYATAKAKQLLAGGQWEAHCALPLSLAEYLRRARTCL